MQDRLPAVLKGKDKPADASEMFEFAELCGILGQPAAAARLYAEALDASPRLADDLHSDHRYRAACAAPLAGRGRGVNGAGLSRSGAGAVAQAGPRVAPGRGHPLDRGAG